MLAVVRPHRTAFIRVRLILSVVLFCVMLRGIVVRYAVWVVLIAVLTASEVNCLDFSECTSTGGFPHPFCTSEIFNTQPSDEDVGFKRNFGVIPR